jgi:putative ABC transport system ATP-binding protein
MDAIREVGLEPIVLELPDGLDTRLSAAGWPFTVSQTMQLKLAGALLAEPQVVILSQVYDALPTQIMQSVQAKFAAMKTIVIRFTHQPNLPNGDRFLYLARDRQLIFDSWDALQAEVDSPLTPEALLLCEEGRGARGETRDV